MRRALDVVFSKGTAILTCFTPESRSPYRLPALDLAANIPWGIF